MITCLTIGLALAQLQGLAQDAAPLSDVVAKARVLDSLEVDLGSHSIIYNRVETPTLKPECPDEPTNLAQEDATATPGNLTAARTENAKEEVFMSLACTIIENSGTEIHWSRDDGEYVIWSGINFNYLGAGADFETEATRYSIILFNMGESSYGSTPQNQPVSDIPSGSSQYRKVGFPTTGVAAEVKKAMDDLHHYFNLNRDRLIREFQEREQAQLAQEKWLREHPPQPSDVTVNFFPIQSTWNNSAREAE